MFKLYFLSFILLILNLTLYAQNDTIIPLEEVLVEENRFQMPYAKTSRSLSIISKEDLRQTPIQSVPEMLSYIGSVDIRQRGAHGTSADISIRGGTFNQTLVLLNGIKLTDPQTGHHNLALPLHFMNIEQIEVFKGAAARTFGQNAFSGAVNITTSIPGKQQILFRSYAGDYGLAGLGASIALPGKKYSQQIAASADASQGYRFNTDYNNYHFTYQSELDLGAGSLYLIGNHSDREFGANGFYVSTEGAGKNFYEEVQASLVGASYELDKSNLNLKARTYWRRGQDNFIFNRQSPNRPGNYHNSHVYGTEVHTNIKSSAGNTGIGIENRTELIFSSNLGERSRNILGLFLEHRASFIEDRLQVTAGLYGNYYSDFDWQIFPGADIGFQINESLRAYGSFNQTFRIPTYTEWFVVFPGTRGFDQLKPEEATNYEAGLRWLKNGLHIEANYFVQEASNVIDYVQLEPADADGNVFFDARNIRNITNRGIEFSLNVDFPTLLSNSDSFLQNINLAYTYIDITLGSLDFEVLNSRYALENLKHQFIFGLSHKVLKNVYHLSKLRFADRLSLESYWVWDIRLAWQKGQKQIFLEATNLTNEQYIEANLVPMPGRWFKAGVQWDFEF